MAECSVGVVKGSPATLLVDCGDGVLYMVDPGHGRKRASQLARVAERVGAGRLVVLVTHYHSDHHTALVEGLLYRLGAAGVVVEVAAPAADAPLVRDPLLRVVATFGYPLRVGGLLPFRPLASPVDRAVDAPGRLGPLELVPLPGHTPGQVGVAAPGGLLYAADSVFGDRVLERYGVPYHLDPCIALESLEAVRRHVDSGGDLQPSHGPRVSGDEAVGLVERNIRAVERLLSLVLEAVGEPRSSSEAAAYVASRAGAPEEPGLLMLVEATVRGALACLSERGEVEARAEGGRLLWARARR